MMRISAILALIAAVALATVKSLLAEQLWWPFVVSDYLAAGALALGAISVLSGGQGRMLAAGWAVTLGLSWSTLFHHLAERTTLQRLTLVDFGLGLLLTTAVVGSIQCIGTRKHFTDVSNINAKSPEKTHDIS